MKFRLDTLVLQKRRACRNLRLRWIAAGLEYYLKNQSVEDEENNCSRTYLIKDILTAELVAYFSLKTSVYVGVNAVYIYALPEERLINHYRTMGFERLPEQQEKFVQCHVKPKYDEGCIFMYQPI